MASDVQEFEIVLRHADCPSARFRAPSTRSIVRSAARAGIRLTSGCLQGRCAICRARVIEGQVRLLRRLSKHAVGSPIERADGCVLLCSVGPASDLLLEALSPWDLVAPSIDSSGD